MRRCWGKSVFLTGFLPPLLCFKRLLHEIYQQRLLVIAVAIIVVVAVSCLADIVIQYLPHAAEICGVPPLPFMDASRYFHGNFLCIQHEPFIYLHECSSYFFGSLIRLA